MTISVNNQTLEVEARTLLSDVVFNQLGGHSKGIAVAINGQVSPKTSWQETVVNENDDILIIKATQGG